MGFEHGQEVVVFSSVSADSLESAVVEAVRAGIPLGTTTKRLGLTSRLKERANLDRLKLPGANLRSAKLRYALMREANLRGADLTGADLSGAWLHDADLRGANLSGADLSGARLHGADLTDANLSGVRIEWSKHGWYDGRYRDPRPTLTGADLRGATILLSRLGHQDLTECKNLGELVVVWQEYRETRYRAELFYDKNREAILLAGGRNFEADPNGYCYIATAVYGSYDAPQVLVLRRLRDEHLSSSAAGRAFIRAYYTISPPMVALLKDARRTGRIARLVLDRVVDHLERRPNRLGA